MDTIELKRKYILDQLDDVKYYFGSIPSRETYTSYLQTLHIMTLDDENYCRPMCYYNSLVRGYKLIVRNYSDATISITRSEYITMSFQAQLTIGVSFNLYNKTSHPDNADPFLYGGMHKSRFCIDCYKWLKNNIAYMNMHNIYLSEDIGHG